MRENKERKVTVVRLKNAAESDEESEMRDGKKFAKKLKKIATKNHNVDNKLNTLFVEIETLTPVEH